MLILFDNGTPRGLARFLTGHTVEEARARGWEELVNGMLIDVAEQAFRSHRDDGQKHPVSAEFDNPKNRARRT